MLWGIWQRIDDSVDGRKLRQLESGGNEVNHAVKGCTGHDMDEEPEKRVSKSTGPFLSVPGTTYEVTLSKEWKTRELRHMAIATALLPKVKQYALMNNRLLFGKIQMLRNTRRLVK